MDLLPLISAVVIGRTRDDLVFADTQTGMELTVAGRAHVLTSSAASEALPGILDNLEERERADLLNALHSIGFLSDDVLPEPDLRANQVWGAVPLANVVAEAPRLGGTHALYIYTRTEVLVLPRGLSDTTSIEALRLFVSGIRPINLRRCYAFGATAGIVSVFGDHCQLDQLERISEEYGDVHEPVVVPSDTQGEVFTLGRAPGRLHPAQQLVQRRIELGPGEWIYQSGASMPCPDLRFCDIDPDPWAWGHSPDAELASVKAVAEAVERYATGTVPYRRLIHAKGVDLDAEFLDPRRIISFDEDQMVRHAELREFSSNDLRYWVLGEDRAGRPCYVLADLVYNPFVPPESSDQRVHCRANSSGVAYATNGETAKVRALLECVERDAFLRVWYGRVSPAKLASQSAGARVRSNVTALQEYGWSVHLLVLSRSAPVIAAVAASKDGLLIGCATGPPREAAQKALTELSVVMTGLPPAEGILPREIRKAEDHTMLYRSTDMATHAAFLTASEQYLNVSDLAPGNEPPAVDEVYYVRLPAVTNERDHVWRCLAPGLIPMTFGFDTEPRGREDVARAIELAATEHSVFYENDILMPHPFA